MGIGSPLKTPVFIFFFALAVLEDELETFVLLAEQDLHVVPRDPVNSSYNCSLRLAFLLQASQADYSGEAVGGHDPAIVFYHRYPVPLSPLSAASHELGPRVSRFCGQLFKENERDPFYVVSEHLPLYLLWGEQPAEDA